MDMLKCQVLKRRAGKEQSRNSLAPAAYEMISMLRFPGSAQSPSNEQLPAKGRPGRDPKEHILPQQHMLRCSPQGTGGAERPDLQSLEKAVGGTRWHFTSPPPLEREFVPGLSHHPWWAEPPPWPTHQSWLWGRGGQAVSGQAGQLLRAALLSPLGSESSHLGRPIRSLPGPEATAPWLPTSWSASMPACCPPRWRGPQQNARARLRPKRVASPCYCPRLRRQSGRPEQVHSLSSALHQISRNLRSL